MKVSLIQMNSQENKEANLRQAERLIEDAVADGRPDLVVLPEMFTCLSESIATKRAAAEVLPEGDACRFLRSMAVKHRINLHGGSLLERASADTFYNTTVAFDAEGRELARYRKIHLFDVVTPDGREYRESANVRRGDQIVTYEIGGVRIGCSICYDLRFPELYQALARMGAEVIMVPAAFTLQTGKDHWEVLLRARAIETQAYVLAPAQFGSYANGTRTSYGHSMAVDPWGHVLAMAQDKIGTVTATLDFGYLRQVRQRIPVQQHKVL